jgi:hypothetical protein
MTTTPTPPSEPSPAASGAGLRQERVNVFGECLSDYERLRGYVALRHGDRDADPRTVAHWLADNGHGLFVEGVPEADAWRERFWPNVASTE